MKPDCTWKLLATNIKPETWAKATLHLYLVLTRCWVLLSCLLALDAADAPVLSQEEQDEAAVAPRRLQELQANGFSKEDAIAALVVAKDDIAAAIDYHIQHLDQGGAAKVGGPRAG
jgi:uncharacterized protein YoaH (UPF0181 family)